MESPSFIQFSTYANHIYNIAHISSLWTETVIVSKETIEALAHKNIPFDGEKAYCICIRETNGHVRNCVYETPAIRDAAFASFSDAIQPLVIIGPAGPSQNT